ncbi:hypothetical protein H6P81_010549 [Aristolochia fimbriata]|uniref:Metallo-beta-lactamase domain-containing protein n=1 Tax=Aristolochia fimbriata TaxID=158543 RepID=A0AAV7EPS5_ARIFI|nr:hypothetical protein H6P81_010549 [Aristolochia fimbriata]
MANYRVALIVRRSVEGNDFLVVRQTPPTSLPEKEYENYVDSDLWDLPSALLGQLGEGNSCTTVIDGADSASNKVDLQKLDIDSTLDQIFSLVGLKRSVDRSLAFWKCVEEPEFGPGPLIHTLFLVGMLKPDEQIRQEDSKWMSNQCGRGLLLNVKPGNDRIGPLVVTGLLTGKVGSRKWTMPCTLLDQEYPPHVTVIPMRSRTKEPFRTTNLIVIVADDFTASSENSSFSISGDALIMDPGCHTEFHSELMEIVASLPRKLLVFVTHHHYDHVDGLSAIQKINPEATLIAHENTMKRIRKDDWSLDHVRVSGGEEINIGDQRLSVIFAPGHTDGHMGLLHVSTNSLIVGDHCVGQGSALLDIRSGGNMKDYFQTTYKFMEMSPHVLIPMHGRVNLWPKRMLCGYLKHRRDREYSTLKAIESGAETLFDIIAISYADVDVRLWIPASSNVRLHVDYLAHQDKLPKDFSMQKFQRSCLLNFLSRWTWKYLKTGVFIKIPKLSAVKFLTAITLAGLATYFLPGWGLLPKKLGKFCDP